MFDSYVRMNSFFGGTQYEKMDLASYPYDPARAQELLKGAGWNRRGTDGILVNDRGERCSFTLTYGSQGLTRHLTVYVEDLKTSGIEMKLRLVDDAKSFKDGLERNYEALLFGMSGSIYPVPEQYLHSSYAKTKNNNNVFAFASEEVDQLIDIYNTNLDFNARLKATDRIEEIIKDEAFYIPFWHAPYVRALYWNNLGHPDDYEPLYASELNDVMTWWFDQDLDEQLQKAIKEKQAIPGVNDVVDVDPHGLMK